MIFYCTAALEERRVPRNTRICPFCGQRLETHIRHEGGSGWEIIPADGPAFVRAIDQPEARCVAWAEKLS